MAEKEKKKRVFLTWENCWNQDAGRFEMYVRPFTGELVGAIQDYQKREDILVIEEGNGVYRICSGTNLSLWNLVMRRFNMEGGSIAGCSYGGQCWKDNDLNMACTLENANKHYMCVNILPYMMYIRDKQELARLSTPTFS